MSDPLVWLLVEHEGAVLLAHRKEDGAPFAGKWTLPGGVRWDTEATNTAATRLASNDLGLEVMGLAFFDTINVADDGEQYSVDVLRVGYEGRPRYRDSGPYSEVGWTAPSELDELDIELPPELKALLARLA